MKKQTLLKLASALLARWMYNVSAKRFKEEKKSDTKGKLQ